MISLGQMRKGAPLPVWRVLDTGVHSGAENMATDEAMLNAFAKGLIPPTIRFYGWQPSALSLGYFQHAHEEVDVAACRAQGVDIVRRLTGGRAVLHSAELTYSIVVGEDYPAMPMTITASYRYLSQGLLQGLTQLGLRPELTKPIASYGRRRIAPASAACFDAPSSYELTVRGRKLIGSAQVRRQGVILQHGSVLLSFKAQDTAQLLRLAPEEKERTAAMLGERVIALDNATGRTVSFQKVRDVLLEGFQKALGISVEPGELTDWEREERKRLWQTKYTSDEWTFKL